MLPRPPARPLSVPFARDLAAHGDRVALHTPTGTVTYRALAERVATTAERLGRVRRLVLVAGANRADALVTYLAALSAGHPVLLVPGDGDEAIASLTAAYRPDVVARTGTDGTWTLDEHHPGTAHTLHPDLALLLSTSGSTGSPKLVRLSHDNVQANAESIATYLGITDTDRAATTLPMHYCYGLSVIHSHLSRGAGLLLTERSVTDDAFWAEFRAAGATSLAGVPYTFDLLDRIGFDRMELPRLRRITQAGGRLAPERVARYAELGRRRGWDLFVMYGQTEATARMAYLPPHLAATRPEAVGIPIPGGSFRLRPLDDHEHALAPGDGLTLGHGLTPGQGLTADRGLTPGRGLAPVPASAHGPAGGEGDRRPLVGELVYSGPNVMLGYAESPADLSLGRTVVELRTGDLARQAPDGLYEIVGRRSRFAKILGLRIDPQRVEAALERHGVRAYCAGDGDELAITAAGTAADEPRLRRLAAAACGLPPRAVRLRALPEADLPRLPTGKPDYTAVRHLSRPAARPSVAARSTPTPTDGHAGGAGSTPVHEHTPAPESVSAARRDTAADQSVTAEPDAATDRRAPADLSATSGPPSDGLPTVHDRPCTDDRGPTDQLRVLYAEILDRTDVTDDSTFVGLGGDSLCYVEMSLRLEQALGALPPDWHTRPLRDLATAAATPAAAVRTGTGPAPTRSGLRRTLETGIALRAVGIVLIVGSHIHLFTLQGAAHILIGVAGHNFARFHLTDAEHRTRVRHLWRSIARIALPSAAWITAAVLATGLYDPANALLLNSLVDQGPERHEWHYWFIEALLYFLVALALLLTLPLVDRLERRHTFGLPLALLAIGLLGRYDIAGLAPARFHLGPTVVFWLFALGWAAARATTARRRLLLTAVLVLATPGLFQPDQQLRTVVVIAGLTLLIWVPTLPSLAPLNRLAGLLAGSSLYIYLTHFQVYPHLQDDFPALALLASLAVGIAYAAVTTRVTRAVRRP
ncbi:non-ribosomal peptide synthetase [Streptomyces ossamyceticus]|uniref:non-ribosomal peptide synthetase n=1 Tax=Streptomyces ossamyceticus TaxID=249581 RepID=UPI00347FB492